MGSSVAIWSDNENWKRETTIEQRIASLFYSEQAQLGECRISFHSNIFAVIIRFGFWVNNFVQSLLQDFYQAVTQFSLGFYRIENDQNVLRIQMILHPVVGGGDKSFIFFFIFPGRIRRCIGMRRVHGRQQQLKLPSGNILVNVLLVKGSCFRIGIYLSAPDIT